MTKAPSPCLPELRRDADTQKIKRDLVLFRSLNDLYFDMMPPRTPVMQYGLKIQAVPPVLIKISVKKPRMFLIPIENEARHRSRTADSLSIDHRDPASLDIEGEAVSHT